MIFKADLTKQKSFEKKNRKVTFKLFLPIIFVFIVFMDLNIIYVLLNEHIKNLFILIVLIDILFILIILLSVFIGVKIASKIFPTFELTIEDNYAILKNKRANVFVRFYDIKSYKESKGFIDYKLGLLRHFYIGWEDYENSEELKKQLDIITSKIGTYEKNDSENISKTKVKFNKNQTIRIIILIVICIALLIVNHFID